MLSASVSVSGALTHRATEPTPERGMRVRLLRCFAPDVPSFDLAACSSELRGGGLVRVKGVHPEAAAGLLMGDGT